MILHLQGKVAFVSAYGIHQLHIFIFMLAVFHILQCIVTLALGRTNIAYPERFRLAKDTTFGQRHLNTWSQSSISLWIASFFRQFSGSVQKAHLAPGSDARFDFQKYIKRSLDEDFKVVVGIIAKPYSSFQSDLNMTWWYSYYWLPFIPLIAILLVGAKLQMITKMGLRIQDRGEVFKGAPVVEPGDDLFWFNRPRFLLFIIHLVLFQNAFQLAHFAWSTYEFSINSCFHKTTIDTIIRLTMGVVIQVLCSYVILPLYALMASTMKPTIFNDRVAAALKKWHHTSKKHVKHRKHSEGNNATPFSSRSSTPTFGMSPIHLLHRHLAGRSESAQTSPRISNYENEQCDVDGEASTSYHPGTDDTQMQVLGPHSTTELRISTKHDINFSSSEFSFEKRNTRGD
uniref:MLO-like protein n=1 Tax=Glycine max TaxID=3847 RepID=A0A0R0KTC4_SOYBN